MCDEKRIIISVLRALLISKGKNVPVKLSELRRDYCMQEGKTEIPRFEYRTVGDFLHSSGEFILTVFNGDVMVREKPKSESLHIKKFIMEQKSGKRTSTPPLRNNINNTNHKIITAHSAKPSVVFTFDELNNSLNNDTVIANSLETNSLDSQDEIECQNDRLTTPVHEEKRYDNSCCDASTKTVEYEQETDVDARLRLLDAILTVHIEEDYGGDYCATISVNNKKYYGYGSSVDVAKNDVLENVLKFTKQKTEQVFTKPTIKDNDGSSTSSNNKCSFYLLNQMTNVLEYHFHKVDDFYLSSITVEGREYNALGVSEASAKDKVAKKVFADKEVILLIKMRASNEWKILGIVNGLHKVTVKIDGMVYDGEGYNLNNAVANCIENAMKMKPGTSSGTSSGTLSGTTPGTLSETSSDTNQTTSLFKTLSDKCGGLTYVIISPDSDNYKVMMQLDAVSYFSEGPSIDEANENAANECLKSVLNGYHQKAIETRKTQETSKHRFNASMSGSLLQSKKLYPQESYNNLNHFNYNTDINAIRALLVQHFQRAHYYSSLDSRLKRC